MLVYSRTPDSMLKSGKPCRSASRDGLFPVWYSMFCPMPSGSTRENRAWASQFVSGSCTHTGLHPGQIQRELAVGCSQSCFHSSVHPFVLGFGRMHRITTLQESSVNALFSCRAAAATVRCNGGARRHTSKQRGANEMLNSLSHAKGQDVYGSSRRRGSLM